MKYLDLFQKFPSRARLDEQKAVSMQIQFDMFIDWFIQNPHNGLKTVSKRWEIEALDCAQIQLYMLGKIPITVDAQGNTRKIGHTFNGNSNSWQLKPITERSRDLFFLSPSLVGLGKYHEKRTDPTLYALAHRIYKRGTPWRDLVDHVGRSTLTEEFFNRQVVYFGDVCDPKSRIGSERFRAYKAAIAAGDKNKISFF